MCKKKAENNNYICLLNALYMSKNGNCILVGRCSSCKNWVYNDYVLQGYSNRYKMCNIATEEDSNGIIDTTCSSEGISGELITRDDFGCILYNAK